MSFSINRVMSPVAFGHKDDNTIKAWAQEIVPARPVDSYAKGVDNLANSLLKPEKWVLNSEEQSAVLAAAAYKNTLKIMEQLDKLTKKPGFRELS
jgi:hypothetical protein